MRVISVLGVCIALGIIVGCDSSNPAVSGDGPDARDTTSLVGRWAVAYEDGQKNPLNNILTLYSDGSYVDVQNPPWTDDAFFFRDSGTWVASRDTFRVESVSFRASYDGGVTWSDGKTDSATFVYRITGDQLFIVRKNPFTGQEYSRYYVKVR